MESRKKEKRRLLIIILLIIMLLGSIGYIVYDKMANNNVNSLQLKISKQKETIDNLNTLLNSTQENTELVNTPNYNIVTKQIAKSLVGKYVSNTDSNSYFEIKKNGELLIVQNLCEGYATYSNKELDFLAYYENSNDGFQRTIITFIKKTDSENTFGASKLTLTFQTTDKIENNNIVFNGDDIGCGAESYTKE